jgi:site-specific recombinase XerD
MRSIPTLADLLESFFHQRLTRQRNASAKTISSYRDALRLLIRFASERAGRKPYRLELGDLDRDAVLAFLDHLESCRGNCIRTRNARLTAIRSFFQHVAATDPASFGIAQRILMSPSKRCDTEITRHLSKRELAALLDAPDRQTPRGRRDHTLLLFLVRTGARISEALGVDAVDLQLDRPKQVRLRGKGRKQRAVPLTDDLSRALEALLRERGLGRHEPRPIFVGDRGERLTRFGGTHILRRAVAGASKQVPGLEQRHVSPHVLRHTLAMTLLQSGVDLVTIQAWLGHAQVATTHRYAEADVEMMRRGLEKAGVPNEAGARFRPKDAVLRLLEER